MVMGALILSFWVVSRYTSSLLAGGHLKISYRASSPPSFKITRLIIMLKWYEYTVVGRMEMT